MHRVEYLVRGKGSNRELFVPSLSSPLGCGRMSFVYAYNMAIFKEQVTQISKAKT